MNIFLRNILFFFFFFKTTHTLKYLLARNSVICAEKFQLALSRAYITQLSHSFHRVHTFTSSSLVALKNMSLSYTTIRRNFHRASAISSITSGPSIALFHETSPATREYIKKKIYSRRRPSRLLGLTIWHATRQRPFRRPLRERKEEGRKTKVCSRSLMLSP